MLMPKRDAGLISADYFGIKLLEFYLFINEVKKLTLATILVVLASIGFGLVPFFAKSLTDAGMASPAVAFYRYALTSFVLLPFLKIGKDGRFQTLWGICAGAAMGIGWIGYVNALKNASISTVGVIYMTYPIFTVLIAWLRKCVDHNNQSLGIGFRT